MVLIRTAQTSDMIEKCSSIVPEIQLTDKYKTRISDKSVSNFSFAFTASSVARRR
jgi:hypothetical protein